MRNWLGLVWPGFMIDTVTTSKDFVERRVKFLHGNLEDKKSANPQLVDCFFPLRLAP